MRTQARFLADAAQECASIAQGLPSAPSLPPSLAAVPAEIEGLRAQIWELASAIDGDGRELAARADTAETGSTGALRALLKAGARGAQTVVWYFIDRAKWDRWAVQHGRAAVWDAAHFTARQRAIRAALRSGLLASARDGAIDLLGVRVPLVAMGTKIRNLAGDAIDWADNARVWRASADRSVAAARRLDRSLPRGTFAEALRGGERGVAKYGLRRISVANMILAPLMIPSDINAFEHPKYSGGYRDADAAARGLTLGGDVTTAVGGTLIVVGGATSWLGGAGLPIVAAGVVLVEAGSIMSTVGVAADIGVTAVHDSRRWASDTWQAVRHPGKTVSNLAHDVTKWI